MVTYQRRANLQIDMLAIELHQRFPIWMPILGGFIHTEANISENTWNWKALQMNSQPLYR